MGPYAALGDSFSAGVGAGPSSDRTCLRTAQAYPQLWSRAHPGTATALLACSGARIRTVRQSQVPRVPRDARLVTVTMGGNDVGFSAVLAVCGAGSPGAACRVAVSLAEAVAVTAVPVELALTLSAIKDRAPHARVVVLGYPHLFELGTCPAGRPDVSRRKAINHGTDLLDGVLSRTAGVFGARFVDVRDRFTGHGICAPAGQAWINGPGDGEGSYHPDEAGQARGYLPALAALTG